MKYKFEKRGENVVISFSVTQEEWAEHTQKAYDQNKGKYNVAGFRKGHVPRKVLENVYGADLFFEDALYNAATEYYGQFLDNNKQVVPVSRPTLDDNTIRSNNKGIEFDIIVVTKPDVELGQYKGLTIEKTKPAEVSAEQVDAELKRIQQRNARFVEITDRAVQNGDQVDIDYSGSVDGEKFDGGTATGQTLEIGSNTFIPGFEPQLIGMTIGEVKNIEVTFPSDYHAENLKGKIAVFEIKLNGITLKQMPEIDDEFAKDVSEFSTLEEYKADILKNFETQNQKTALDQDQSNLVDKIVENTKIEIPNQMIEDQIDDYIEDFKYQLSYQGLKIEDYFKYTGQKMEVLRETHKERAEKAVRTRLVFEAIVKAEQIKPDQESIDKKISEYAVQIGQDQEEFKQGLTAEQTAYFENQVVTEKLLEFLKQQNTIA